MLTFVLAFNCLLAILCLAAAWQIWKLRRSLAHVADVLTAAEQKTHRVLQNAPDSIRRGQVSIYELRQQIQQLEPQLQQLQRVVGLLQLGQLLWRQRPNQRRSPKRSPAKRRQHLPTP